MVETMSSAAVPSNRDDDVRTGPDLLRFGPEVRWRVSKRGLVLADPRGETLLLEHPAAARLSQLLGDGADRTEVIACLDQPDAPELVDHLVGTGLLTGPGRQAPVRDRASGRVRLTRSGLEITGIDTLAGWLNARLMPVLVTTPARVVILLVVAAGLFSLLQGRPAGPAVSSTPALDAILGLLLGLGCIVMHELAHAVALAHYGRRARRAGFGFYWGAVSFYVDATDGLTLARRQRVVQALAGLGVDLVTVAILAIVAQASGDLLITAVAWRVALLGCLSIVTNAAPILEVDGQVALADYLDEPDLARRSREALGGLLQRRRLPMADRWMPLYGAVSLLGGILLLVTGLLVFWHAAGDLVLALLHGNPGEVLLIVPIVGPVVACTALSFLGLLVEIIRPSAVEP